MQVSLSVLTSSSLAPDLKAVKQSLRFPLIRFEDAKVELGECCCILGCLMLVFFTLFAKN